MKELTPVGITLDLKERMDMALNYLKSTGEFDAVVRNGKLNQQQPEHGETLNHSCQQNMQRRTSKANSQQNN
jgi:hypothetical protein